MVKVLKEWAGLHRIPWKISKTVYSMWLVSIKSMLTEFWKCDLKTIPTKTAAYHEWRTSTYCFEFSESFLHVYKNHSLYFVCLLFLVSPPRPWPPQWSFIWYKHIRHSQRNPTVVHVYVSVPYAKICLHNINIFKHFPIPNIFLRNNKHDSTELNELTKLACTVASSIYFAIPVTKPFLSSKFVSKFAWYTTEHGWASIHGCSSGNVSSSKTSTFDKASVSVTFSVAIVDDCIWN